MASITPTPDGHRPTGAALANAPQEPPPERDPSPKPTEDLELFRACLVWLFICTLAIAFAIALPLILMEAGALVRGAERIDLPILALVALSGALGALFSALTRLYSFSVLPSALTFAKTPSITNKYVRIFCLVPPLIGMIGAVFFYVFMISGIVSTDIFVQFECSAAAGCAGVGGLLAYSPVQPQDYAKAIVWGFVAGFSERLVPNALARLDAAASEQR